MLASPTSRVGVDLCGRLCAYMCSCVRVCVCVCVFMCACLCVCMCVFMCVHVCLFVCVCVLCQNSCMIVQGVCVWDSRQQAQSDPVPAQCTTINVPAMHYNQTLYLSLHNALQSINLQSTTIRPCTCTCTCTMHYDQ